MTTKKWLASVGTLAIILALNSIWLYWRVSQGVGYCASMLGEKQQSTDLLEVLTQSRLVGNLNEQDFVELLKTHYVPYYPMEGNNVLFSSYLVFEFDGGVLRRIHQATN